MTRQELTDAVAEVIGVHPLLEVKVDTIIRLADLYAQDAYAAAERELARRRRTDEDHLSVPRLRSGPDG